jgi:hypothetical protein
MLKKAFIEFHLDLALLTRKVRQSVPADAAEEDFTESRLAYDNDARRAFAELLAEKDLTESRLAYR